MHKDFNLFTTANNKIAVTIYGYQKFAHNPCLIYVHGFKGFKDWGFVPFVGEYFASKGYSVITFNFSHNGIGEKKSEFTELEKFANNTFSLETKELSEIVDAYFFGFFGETSNSKLGIIGHSRGSAVTVFTVRKRKEISALALWAPIAKIDRYTDRQKTEWEEKGYLEFLNTRTNQMMRVNYKLLEDIEKNKDRKLNIENAVRKYRGPLLIIHGEQDLTVPAIEGEMIYEWSNKKKSSYVNIPATGHTFDVVHPFNGSNPKFDRVLNETEQFFNKYLF
jgi:uncharacterized protein